MEFVSRFSEQLLCNEANTQPDMATDVDVSVIIPSRAESSRAGLIDRAIDSVLGQNGVRATPIVVVNGDHYDSALLHRLVQRRDIRCILLDGNLPEARLAGRDAVDAPFFAFLDDDDELLPRSIELRLRPMIGDDTIDLVVTNGFRRSASETRITDPDIERYQDDPLRALIKTCWLNANAGLFRAATIGREFFLEPPPDGFLEWTYLAFKLAQSRKISFINAQTFVTNDTPGSMSKSTRYIRQHPKVLAMILGLPLPPDIRAGLKRKYYSVLHDLSVTFLERREFGTAWRFHLQSLGQLSGWHYLPYTRRIVWQQLARKPRG